MKNTQSIQDFYKSVDTTFVPVNKNIFSKEIQLQSSLDVLKYIVAEIGYTHRINDIDCRILLFLLQSNIGFGNGVFISADDRKKIIVKFCIDASILSRTLKNFRDKKLFIKNGKVDILNPLYFGNGAWMNQVSLSVSHTTSYDFDCNLISNTITCQGIYKHTFLDENLIISSDETSSSLKLIREKNKAKELEMEIKKLKIKLFILGKS
jgi:hypothetical protein